MTASLVGFAQLQIRWVGSARLAGAQQQQAVRPDGHLAAPPVVANLFSYLDFVEESAPGPVSGCPVTPTFPSLTADGRADTPL